MTYATEIQQALGIPDDGKERVRFEMFDMGRTIGVLARYPDDRQFALRLPFADDWRDEAIAEIAARRSAYLAEAA